MNLVDWISFTIPIGSMIKLDHEQKIIFIPAHVRDEFPHICDYVMSFPDLTPGRGRKMFDCSVRSEVGGFTIYWREGMAFTLFEFSGVGCSMLRKRKSLRDMIMLYADRVTRVDVATDIECSTTPDEFVQQRDQKRFKSGGYEKSESGTTYYVGSKKSDRFARVYRYNEPHPRAGRLRVEHVFRKAEAKQLAALMTASSLSSVVSAVGNTFGWKHEVWSGKRNDAKLKAAPREINQGATERWLLTKVLPAIRRLIDEGGEQTVAIFGERVYAMFDEKRRRVEEAKHDTLL